MDTPLVATRFRVRNYKSIRDSGDIWMSPDLTILAGQNESGKSSLLEALRDFHPLSEDIHQDAIPVAEDDAIPEIMIWFSVPQSLIITLLNESALIGSDSQCDALVRNGVGIALSRGGKHRLTDDTLAIVDSLVDSYQQFDSNRIFELEHEISTICSIHSLPSPIEPTPELSEKERLTNAYNWITETKQYILDHDREAPDSVIDRLSKLSFCLPQPPNDGTRDRLLFAALKRVPPFVFFSDTENLLPFSVPLNEASDHPAIADFATIANLDIKHLMALGPGQKQRNYLQKQAARISGDFRDHYSQNTVELVAEIDGPLLRVGIRSEGDTSLYRAEQRSRGLQWFLSFFLRLTASCRTGALVLIDEPGLYLHAKAQKDILGMLETICKTYGCRVVLSTHSPFMIAPDRLDRVRLVENSESSGTVVENKIHREAKNDSVTPIIASIGLDVARSFAPVGTRNVIVEGISDYYYLQAFHRLIESAPKHVSYIPAAGAPKIPQIASLLIGWGLTFSVLLDNDKDGDLREKELRSLDVPATSIVRVPVKGSSIEGVFVNQDLARSVFPDTPIEDAKLGDKVLVAKKFLEIATVSPVNLQLSAGSMSRIRELLNLIDSSLADTRFTDESPQVTVPGKRSARR